MNELEKILNINFPKDTRLSFATNSSHKVKKNTIFFGLPGTNNHGSKFCKDAINLGAALAVHNDPKYKTIVETLKTDLKSIRKKYHFDSDQYPFNKIIEAYWDYDTTDYENAILISNKARQIIINAAEEKRKRKAIRGNKKKI